ncbi:tetrahydromethanopterin S-methyltransferase subunit F [Candidatus Hecatella orcuttiae]|jgi:tetrahydromethanopterin S-methyltransferase subunit A|uniref:tetrahydromethanopterin S-methyltransferase subunit F n=1 Tax=Candidatus Hecatella orcuttiae TaxID=1935119 RepID=UPI0028681645|nr:tetrahydromethanopterin S-methyltransferase subunit F [Candidatus Hecatella orcuttiae]
MGQKEGGETAEPKPKVNKVPVSEWPVAPGDYYVGNPEGCVAVVTLASAALIKPLLENRNVALCGECKTENVGIEKVILNTISNPNIRFVVVCGTEVAGHVTGGCFKALWEFGVDPETKKIIKAPGAIPYIEAVPPEGVERFRKQVQMAAMVDVEDLGVILAKIEELAAQDPGAFGEPPMIIKIAEKVEEKAAVRIPLMVSLPPAVDSMRKVVGDVEYKVRLLTRERRLTMGVYSTRHLGFALGFFAALGTLFLLLLAGLG